MDKYEETIDELRQFTADRDWDQFHDSKNLALAISIEAAELNELFLWKKDKEIESVDKERLEEELADILSYALLLAEKHSMDICDIIHRKIQKNAEKYPIEKARGSAKKYDQL